MSEGSGLENAEIKKIVEPPKTPDSPIAEKSTDIKSERSLARDLADFALGKMDFEQSPHVVEHVDRAELGRLISEIAAFYDAPQRAINNGMKADIFVTKDDSFIKFKEVMVRHQLKEEIQKIETEEEKEKFIKEEAQITEGFRISTKLGKEIILIGEKSGLDRRSLEVHEILHSMSQGEAGEPSGFEKDGKWTNINEATTELLTLHFQYPNLNVEDLYLKVYDKEFNCGYRDGVKTMLLMMLRTDYNNKPFTFNDLAKHYFHDVRVENDAFVGSLIGQISSRALPELQEKTLGCLVTDLYDEKMINTLNS